MDKELKLRCKNNGQTLIVPLGSNLKEVYALSGLSLEHGPVCATVNNKVKGMNYRFYNNKDVEFLTLHSEAGMATYVRTLFLLLSKAVNDLFPKAQLRIEAYVSRGYYCEIGIGQTLEQQDVERIRQRMKELVQADLPIQFVQCPVEEAVDMYRDLGMKSQERLIESLDTLYTDYYRLEDSVDFFYHSCLLTRTGQIGIFDLCAYYEGILLRIPSRTEPTRLEPMTEQGKTLDVIREHHHWQDIMGIRTVGDLNQAVAHGKAADLINVSEALQEKKLSHIADEIVRRKAHMILIAGPSSSGKTTTAKRMATLMMACGMRPHTLSTDDYFVNRVDTPRDKNGDYDFECIEALDHEFFNRQMTLLLNGEEVELPRFDFHTGCRVFEGNTLKIGPEDIIILEGTHALNPILTQLVPEEEKYRIYVSPLTAVQLDDHNCIHSTDIRLLRRILRDYKYRGYSAQETIKRFPSVKAGEEKWIFPFMNQADTMFNSALLYETGVIKEQVLPLLRQVRERDREFAEAHRLRNLLSYFRNIPDVQVPPTSLLREFAGGSSFKY